MEENIERLTDYEMKKFHECQEKINRYKEECTVLGDLKAKVVLQENNCAKMLEELSLKKLEFEKELFEKYGNVEISLDGVIMKKDNNGEQKL